MKRTKIIFLLYIVLFMASCSKTNDDVISYSSKEIYLKCIDYGNIISGFPKELLIFESEEQLQCAMNEYKCIGSLSELNAIMEEYPIGEYIYILQYLETTYGAKVKCKELKVNKAEMTIALKHKIKISGKAHPAAIASYITYAVLPKEYLSDYDFSNQQGVLYLGK